MPRRVATSSAKRRARRWRAKQKRAPQDATPFDIVPDEIIVEILMRLPRGRDLVRCMLVCRRWKGIITDKRSQASWRQAVLEAASRVHFVGPWLEVAAEAKGWVWVWCALSPLSGKSRRRGREAEAAAVVPDAAKTVVAMDRSAGPGIVKCGEMLPDGTLEGYAVRVLDAPHWACGQWRQGLLHGHGIESTLTMLAAGDLRKRRYEGAWRLGEKHGWGTVTTDGASTCACAWFEGERHGPALWTGTTYGGWHRWGIYYHDRRHGPAVYSACPAVTEACSRIDVASWDPTDGDGCMATLGTIAESLFFADEAHQKTAHALCGHSDFVDWERWQDGKQHGALVRRYCSGDVVEEHYEQGKLDERRLRIVCSPWSADPELRSRVIEAPRWVGHCATCFRHGTDSIMSHPHPREAPEAFALFCRWYGRHLECASA
jgi:hypothetical protein